MIDPSVDKQSFIEDCEVCCNPLEFDLIVLENCVESFSVIQIDQ